MTTRAREHFIRGEYAAAREAADGAYKILERIEDEFEKAGGAAGGLEAVPAKPAPAPGPAAPAPKPSNPEPVLPSESEPEPRPMPPASVPESEPEPPEATEEPDVSEPQPISLTIEADDARFYNEEGDDIASISVSAGSDVLITFRVREAGVYFGGLDFRGCGAESAAGKPGETVQFSFTASGNCTITSYWPQSGASKDRLEVIVE